MDASIFINAAGAWAGEVAKMAGIGVGGEYPIQLFVTDIHNCTDYVEGTVIINDIFQFFMPNSFTPNGDGVNDVYFVEGADIDETRFSLEIFNRWGDVVFKTTDPSTPWLAETHDGDYYIQDGFYNWHAIVISKSTGERHELNGSINVLR